MSCAVFPICSEADTAVVAFTVNRYEVVGSHPFTESVAQHQISTRAPARSMVRTRSSLLLGTKYFYLSF